MAKEVTKLYCDTCGSGIVKLIVSKLKSGAIKISVTQCSRCRKGFGLTTIQDLKRVEDA